MGFWQLPAYPGLWAKCLKKNKKKKHILFIPCNNHKLHFLPPGEDMVPKSPVEVQEIVQKRRAVAGSQSERQRFNGMQFAALPCSLGFQHTR